MRRIIIDADKCQGCKNCAAACMHAHAPDGAELSFDDVRLEPRNTILMNDKCEYKPLFCRHCKEPACAKACITGALVKDAETKHVLYDKDRCASCFMCVMSCPFGVLKPDRETRAFIVKCDFCKEHGSDPNCVKNCPTKAITVATVAEGRG